MSTILIRFQRFCPLTILTTILKLRTCVWDIVKINPSVWWLLLPQTHTLKRKLLRYSYVTTRLSKKNIKITKSKNVEEVLQCRFYNIQCRARERLKYKSVKITTAVCLQSKTTELAFILFIIYDTLNKHCLWNMLA